MTDHRSSYALDLENGEKHVIVKLYYYIGSANTGWQAQIGKIVSGHWEPIDMTSGKYAMKGPTLEAAFPLEPIKKNLGSTSGSDMVFARTHYDDDHGNLEAYGDITETRQFVLTRLSRVPTTNHDLNVPKQMQPSAGLHSRYWLLQHL